MTEQLPLSAEEFEELTQVSGLSSGERAQLVFDIYTVLSVAIEAFVNTGGRVVYTGTTYLIGVTMVPVASLAPGVLGTALFASGLIATILSLPMVLLALGLPVAQAKEAVANKNIKNGFVIGCVIGIFGFGKPMMNDFKHRIRDPGFAPRYMTGVAQGAFNAGLALGYSGALRLKPNERRVYLEIIAARLISEAEADGRKLHMQSWSDRTWIFEYARIFARL